MMSEHIHDFFERYSDRYMPEPNSGCWLWFGSQTTAGYGNLTYKGQSLYAHRASFECANGPGSADGLVIRHKCDNPPCINPAHLLSGSHQDNYNDAKERDRLNPVSGTAVNTAKMNSEMVLAARARAAAGECIAAIARDYPISFNAMEHLIKGKTWKHLPGAVPVPTKGKPSGPQMVDGAYPTARLTIEQAREIKRRALNGEPYTSIMKDFGVSRPTVSAIKVGRNWSHL